MIDFRVNGPSKVSFGSGAGGIAVTTPGANSVCTLVDGAASCACAKSQMVLAEMHIATATTDFWLHRDITPVQPHRGGKPAEEASKDRVRVAMIDMKSRR
ncbi:MAG: hypothetical protein Rhob2KO_01870 [Rhodopirellula baltica]